MIGSEVRAKLWKGGGKGMKVAKGWSVTNGANTNSCNLTMGDIVKQERR